MKSVFFIFILVGMAAASCDTSKCQGKGDLGKLLNCKTAGENLGKELQSAQSMEDMNEAYEKFCVKQECSDQIDKILSSGLDCDCLFLEGRINSFSMVQMCTKDDKGDYFGSRLLHAIQTPAQCTPFDQKKDKCQDNTNCEYNEPTSKCYFKPNKENLKKMCNDEVLDYLRKNPTGGAFSGQENTPTLLATVLTYCLKQDDEYCVLSESTLPFKMTSDSLKDVCGSKKLACARSRLTTVAATFRVEAINKKNNTPEEQVTQEYVLANSLDYAAQDLCVKNDNDYCLVGATTVATCSPDCSSGSCSKESSKKILDSCCGTTIRDDNLLLSSGIQYPMSFLYPSSPLRLNIPKVGADNYDAAQLLEKSNTEATKQSKEELEKLTCIGATIPSTACVTPTETELGEVFATISFDALSDKLKGMLPFFIKTDLAIQLAVPFYTLSLSEPEKSDLNFYLDSAKEKTAGIKYKLTIKAEESLAKVTKENFETKMKKMQFFFSGAFLSVNGNGQITSGIQPLLLTKEHKENVDGEDAANANTTTTTENTLGVFSESTLLLVFVTVSMMIFAM